MSEMESRKISENELEADGWEYTGQNHAGCKIFKKGKKRLLWDPESQIVKLEYEKRITKTI
jgi:hypothetical protein